MRRLLKWALIAAVVYVAWRCLNMTPSTAGEREKTRG
jgi:hypothetical protein